MLAIGLVLGRITVTDGYPLPSHWHLDAVGWPISMGLHSVHWLATATWGEWLIIPGIKTFHCDCHVAAESDGSGPGILKDVVLRGFWLVPGRKLLRQVFRKLITLPCHARETFWMHWVQSRFSEYCHKISLKMTIEFGHLRAKHIRRSSFATSLRRRRLTTSVYWVLDLTCYRYWY